MNLSRMTKSELIERIHDLQFSLKEAHKVIQYFSRDIPAYRKEKESEKRDNINKNVQPSLRQEIDKYDLFNLYDSIVAAGRFEGHNDKDARQDALNTVIQVLIDEGVIFNKNALIQYFPADPKLFSRNPGK